MNFINIYFQSVKKIVIFLFLIVFTYPVYSQDYVKVTATPSKKEFQVSDNIKINIKASIQEGYHINANVIADEDLIPTSLTFKEGDFKPVKINWPKAKTFKFSFSETELQVYVGSFNIGLNLKAKKDLKPGKYEVSGSIHYQACNDRACYAPKDAEFNAILNIVADSSKNKDTSSGDLNINENKTKQDSVKLTEAVDSSKIITSSTNKDNKGDSAQVTATTNQNKIAKEFEDRGLFVTLILIFLGGLALNLTPCIYPLIPITISYFGAQVSGKKGKKIFMGVAYALGMSVTYSVLGLIAGLTGHLFGSALQNPIVVGALVVIFLGLALSMFGLYEIRIPQSLANFSGKSRQGYFGTALMGLTVGVIAAPCIGPFVAALLGYVGELGKPLWGFLLFFIISFALNPNSVFASTEERNISPVDK